VRRVRPPAAPFTGSSATESAPASINASDSASAGAHSSSSEIASQGTGYFFFIDSSASFCSR
jgi:hypothetical protein